MIEKMKRKSRPIKRDERISQEKEKSRRCGIGWEKKEKPRSTATSWKRRKNFQDSRWVSASREGKKQTRGCRMAGDSSTEKRGEEAKKTRGLVPPGRLAYEGDRHR